MSTEFLALVEHGTRFYTRKGVLISFEAAKAWIWEDDGPSTHASIIDVAELMDPSRGAFLAGPDETWLRPLLARLLVGEDPARLRSTAIVEYRARHGEPPAALVYDHPLT